MNNSSQAKEDIQVALELNHLNYIAYFNLFSIHCKQNEYEQALLALRAAISCLLLIKGRLKQDKTLLSKAIEYSVNNIDAILLLVLLETTSQNYSRALSLVEAAKALKENQALLHEVGVFIQELKASHC
jgi:Tfp pilus assembly protein PilF